MYSLVGFLSFEKKNHDLYKNWCDLFCFVLVFHTLGQNKRTNSHDFFWLRTPTRKVGLVIDLSSNGLFHRELTVSAKIDPDSGCHLSSTWGGSWGLEGLTPLFAAPLSPPSVAKDVAVVWLLPRPIRIEASGVIPKVPKSGSCLPLV